MRKLGAFYRFWLRNINKFSTFAKNRKMDKDKKNKDKDEKFIEYWENSMLLGRVKYSLINAVLMGIIVFLISNIVYYFFTGITLFQLSMDAFLSFAMSYLFSFLFYYIPVWNINSFKYNVVLKKKKKSKKK